MKFEIRDLKVDGARCAGFGRNGWRAMPRASQMSRLRFGFRALLFVLVGLSVVRSWAQTNVATPSAKRYLLVIETSRAMQARMDGALNVVADLLTSGMGGQLRFGDTLGVWTFNEKLYAGQFPLQHWSSQGADGVTSQVVKFVRAQKYERTARPEKVLPALEGLVRSSSFITIILVTSGEEKLEGTPFDQAINDTYARWRVEQAKAQMPFATVLRAREGKITEYSVTAAPWRVQMPPLPAEFKPLAAGQEKTASRTKPEKAPAPAAPPLIVHGGKPSPAQDQASPGTAGSETAAIDSLRPSATTDTAVAALTPSGQGTSPRTQLPRAEPATQPAPGAGTLRPNAAPEPRSTALLAAAGVPGGSEARRPAQGGAAPGTGPLSATTGGAAETLAPRQTHPATLASPGEPWIWKHRWLAAVLAVIAAAMASLFFRARRPRPVGSASLITRSLEREGRA